MGTTQHDAVIATTWSDEAWDAGLERWAFKHPARFARKSAPVVNNFRTLVLLPDGSNEGWADSDMGDAFRQEFIDWLRERGPDGQHWTWVEVSFGEYGQAVTRGNCINHFTLDDVPSFANPERLHRADTYDGEAERWIIGTRVALADVEIERLRKERDDVTEAAHWLTDKLRQVEIELERLKAVTQ